MNLISLDKVGITFDALPLLVYWGWGVVGECGVMSQRKAVEDMPIYLPAALCSSRKV